MIPDFKKMTREELMAFWSRYHRASRKDAEALVGDRRPGFTVQAARLANVACNTAVAMGCRADGDEVGAACYEHAVRLGMDGLDQDVRERLLAARKG